MNHFFQNINQILLSEETRKKAERFFVIIAIVSFIIHLTAILLIDVDILETPKNNSLIISPLAAIYTPFSFILIYEVYLLVFYLPKSMTDYIGKQYEIITLILIRKIFYDLSQLKLNTNWFETEANLKFTYDILGVLSLFVLIFFFYKLSVKYKEITVEKQIDINEKTKRFIKIKTIMANMLVLVVFFLAIYSFVNWIFENTIEVKEVSKGIKDVNSIFFDDFFTVLILTDVLLLLITFFQTDVFSRVIRNSGFIISTIMIKLSFSANGVLNTILIVSAVGFGVLLLLIFNQYKKIEVKYD
ncbi:MAG: hypothetical protein RI562_06485 [Salibacter sp.]|jgi:hypothetical protein|uniref:hypothetical protein n=1 Tax=Salibacter sp. TaxID=2010995 RepID=UPI00286FB6E7|nr:hypothetical protein [Salibacter sp.]MDR9398692.1 hypothetical protein [Salibacter sp.]